MRYFFEVQMHKVEVLIGLVFILAMLLIPYAASAQSSWYSAPTYGGGTYGYDNYGNSFNSQSLRGGGAYTQFNDGTSVYSRPLYNGGYEHNIQPGYMPRIQTQDYDAILRQGLYD